MKKENPMLEAEQLVRRDLVRINADKDEVDMLTRLWVLPMTYAEVFALKTALADHLAKRTPGEPGFDTVAAALSRAVIAAGQIEDRARGRGMPDLDRPFVRLAPAVPISSASGWTGPTIQPEEQQ